MIYLCRQLGSTLWGRSVVPSQREQILDLTVPTDFELLSFIIIARPYLVQRAFTFQAMNVDYYFLKIFQIYTARFKMDFDDFYVSSFKRKKVFSEGCFIWPNQRRRFLSLPKAFWRA